MVNQIAFFITSCPTMPLILEADTLVSLTVCGEAFPGHQRGPLHRNSIGWSLSLHGLLCFLI